MTQEILRRFVAWTKVKVKLHLSSKSGVYFREREVWWCSLGANIGHEQDGKNMLFERPVLVLKKFNRYALWAVPLTSRQKEGKYYCDISYDGKQGRAILSQLRFISSKRLIRKSGVVPRQDFDHVREKIKKLI